MMKRTTVIFLFLCTILWRCASQEVLHSSNNIQQSEIDRRAIEYFVDGVIYDLTENYMAAMFSYQQALLYDSSASEIYLAIGKDYLRLGEDESALRSLLKCVDLDPTEMEARDLIPKIYITQRKWDSAEKMLHQTLSLDSTHLDSYYDLALIYIQNQKTDELITVYEKILSLLETPDTQILLNLADIYIDLGQFENAADIYRQFIETESEVEYRGLGYYGLGFVSDAQKDTLSAIENYRRALELVPDMTQARNRLTQLYIESEEWERALLLCKEAIELDSTDLSNWFDITYIYQQKGDTALALQTLENAEYLFSDNWRFYSYWGYFCMETEKLDLAHQKFEKVIELAPEEPSGWLNSGIALVYLDSLENAQFHFQKVLSIEPEDPTANYYLGSVLVQLARPEEAIPYLEKAIEMREDWLSAISTLAGIFDQLKRYEKSDSLFNEALRLDPDNALINNNYSYSLSERGIRLDEAMEMVQKALKQDPENGAYLDTMGWIYYQIGEYEKALEYIHKAYLVRQESAILADHLGDVYHKLEMKEEARKAWEQALELDENNQDILKKLNRLSEE